MTVLIRKVRSYWVVYVSRSANSTEHFQFTTKKAAEAFAAQVAA